MTPPVRNEQLRRVLKWSQRVLFACGILLLGYCGFSLTDAWIFQRRESRRLEQLLRERSVANSQAARTEAPAPSPPDIAADGLIGRIEIPRLHISAVVVEGVDKTTLRRAVGHIPGTALPGHAGNVGVAAHRDTFFRPLKDTRLRDEIQISTLQGDFKYQVVSMRIVDPSNVSVLASSEENVLTLVTCYPFYYVGPAPQRWIVRAKQVSP